MFARARLTTVAVLVAVLFAVGHGWALAGVQIATCRSGRGLQCAEQDLPSPELFCRSARTRNCIVIPLSEARKRGGRPYQICGGPIVE